MKTSSQFKFFFRIVFPAILTILLFIFSIFSIIIPSMEKQIMERKKEMIKELTHTAWSLLDEYHHEYTLGNISIDEAKTTAGKRIRQLRYGDQYKDYFWIIDMHPYMIMHPYRDELTGSDLTTYEDPNGVNLFVRAVELCQKQHEGFINYLWQWKDDSTKIVPKLSYVKKFEPWDWIVGTGIYLDDVQMEIEAIQSKLINVSLAIIFIVAVILLFVIRSGLMLEKQRKKAENELKLSRQKYKSLVEASTEGTLMIINQEIIFANLKFSALSGYDIPELSVMNFNELFDLEWVSVEKSFQDPGKTISFETRLKCKDGTFTEIVISISKIKQDNKDSHIVIAKKISQEIVFKKETEALANELQSSLLLMNQPIHCFIKKPVRCQADATVTEASKMMDKKSADILFIQTENKDIGVINRRDIIQRVTANELPAETNVIEIMTSPIVTIKENSLLYEAILLINKKQISHLGVINTQNEIIGVISQNDLFFIQQNTLSYLLHEIEAEQQIEGLQKIYNKVPVLVNAMIQSGDQIQNITKMISSISDAMLIRLIEIAIEEFGEPPCRFAFMVMGSEGRMEQTLATDQDNAIVIENMDNQSLPFADEYFKKIATFVSDNLHAIGYNYCKGNIMATNSKWRQPLETWQMYFSNWLNNPDPQSVLDSCIFFDYRFVYGDHKLIQQLSDHIKNTIDNKPIFFYHLAHSVLKFKPPVSMFGTIITDNSSEENMYLNIKKILYPIISFIRLYALRINSTETNSIARLKDLHKQKEITHELKNELTIAYNYLSQLRLRNQASASINNQKPDNQVNIKLLTHIEITTLKNIFKEINNLQVILNSDFGKQE